MGPIKFHSFYMGFFFTSAALALVIPSPAIAGYPGSTQPGAQQVPPGNLVVIRDVPARNAIISGAGDALAVPTAPPSTVFATIEGVGAPLSDAEEATVTGSIGSLEGRIVAGAVGGVLGSQSIVSTVGPDHWAVSGGGTAVGGALQTGLGAMRSALGSIGGGGL